MKIIGTCSCGGKVDIEITGEGEYKCAHCRRKYLIIYDSYKERYKFIFPCKEKK